MIVHVELFLNDNVVDEFMEDAVSVGDYPVPIWFLIERMLSELLATDTETLLNDSAVIRVTSP